jgi:hydroxymethylglutaryl-CoA synthase
MRGVVSTPATSPSAACSARPCPRCSAAGAGKGDPGGRLPRRGHHHHGGGGGPPRPAAQWPAAAPGAIWFATASPAYLDKTNATTIHAALRQPPGRRRLRLRRCAAVGDRSPVDPPWPRHRTGTTLVVAWPTYGTAFPTSSDESAGGDGAAAIVVGDDGPGTPVIAEYLGGPRSVTSSSTGGGPPVTAARDCGRSGSARPATSRWVRRRGRRR